MRHYVSAPEETATIVEVLRGGTCPLSLDTETVGCDPRKEHPRGKAEVVSVQISDGKGVWFFNTQYDPRVLTSLKPLLESPYRRFVLHNFKYDYHALATMGISVTGLLCDTSMLAYLLDTGRCKTGLGLKGLAKTLLNAETVEKYGKSFSYKDPYGPMGRFTGDVSFFESFFEYGCRDVEFTLALYEKLRSDASTNMRSRANGDVIGNYWDYYETVERPYGEALYRMESRGALLNLEALDVIERATREKMLRAEMEFGAQTKLMVGRHVSITSPKQIASLIYQDLGEAATKLTDGGAPSVDSDTLMAIQSPDLKPLIKEILAYREHSKILGTYVEPLKEICKTYSGRVHTSFRQNGTATGRLSSSNPNLQNQPKELRSAVVAPPGHVLGCIDSSQIEVRLAGMLTGDPNLVRVLLEGWDIHAFTATNTSPIVRDWVGGREITSELLAQVAKEFGAERKKAKAIVFGSFYGMGGKKYASQVGCSEREGYKAIEDFFELFSGLKKTMKDCVEHAKKNGFVWSILRRKMMVPDLKSDVDWIRKSGERQAFNYLIQGSASDLLRLSTILIDQCPKLSALNVRMILSVHDELVFEIPTEHQKEAGELIEKYMSDAFGCFFGKSLPMATPADIGFGATWATAKG